jgi:hypothetical protein
MRTYPRRQRDAVIPLKSNRIEQVQCGKYLQKERNIVEHIFEQSNTLDGLQ